MAERAESPRDDWAEVERWDRLAHERRVSPKAKSLQRTGTARFREQYARIHWDHRLPEGQP